MIEISLEPELNAKCDRKTDGRRIWWTLYAPAIFMAGYENACKLACRQRDMQLLSYLFLFYMMSGIFHSYWKVTITDKWLNSYKTAVFEQGELLLYLLWHEASVWDSLIRRIDQLQMFI
jgi:hypothetical protein